MVMSGKQEGTFGSAINIAQGLNNGGRVGRFCSPAGLIH